QIDMARAAVQVHHDDGLARRAGAGRGPRPAAQHVGQRQAADAQGADLEKVAARKPVAQPLLRSPERQHGTVPPSTNQTRPLSADGGGIASQTRSEPRAGAVKASTRVTAAAAGREFWLPPGGFPAAPSL